MDEQNADREVVALLRGHGVPARAAPPIARAGERLQERTAQSGLEYAALFESDTGTQVGPVLEGQQDQVNLEYHTALLQPGRRYVHLHTHPGDSSFSHHDLAILLRYPELRTMGIVGLNGSWYLLSKRRGQPTAREQDGLDLWHVHYARAAEPNDKLVRLGILTEPQALRREVHETMTRLAPELGLRYDHLESLR
jgi:hypothetical protein